VSKNNENKEFTEQQQEVLSSIKVSRIILPILIGVGVVIFLVVRQFDPQEFSQIQWTTRTFIGIAIVYYYSLSGT